MRTNVDRKENPKLYEINTVVWLFELSQKYGNRFTLGNVPEREWDRLRDLGFDYLWLMGVWERSSAGLKMFQDEPGYASLRSLLDSLIPGWTDEDVIGSPYAVASYTPDPVVGTWEDIDRVREELDKRGMKLILDFVPNHTAPDHPWVFAHPDYYIQGNESDFGRHPEAFSLIGQGETKRYFAKGRDPLFPPWPDTVQLNLSRAEVRCALVRELRKIAEHCDGVRCDMAMLVLNDIFRRTWGWAGDCVGPEASKSEFWTEVRYALPRMILLAEAYWDTEWTLQQLGFDYVYDKRLYDRLRSASAYEVYLHLKSDIAFQKRLVRFLETHVEARSAEVFAGDRLLAAATLFSTTPGVKLYGHGQLEGRRMRAPLLLRRSRAEEPDKKVAALYERLLSITKHDVFSRGSWEMKDVFAAGDGTFRHLIAYRWKLNQTLKLIVVNLDGNRAQGRVPLTNEELGEKDYTVLDELNDREYVRAGREMMSPGLYVRLEGFHAHVFDISG